MEDSENRGLQPSTSGTVPGFAGLSLTQVGQVANAYAVHGVLSDHLSRKSDNTLHSHAASLGRFAEFLALTGAEVGDLQHDPEAWRGMTHGLVKGFRNWMLSQGDAVASINARLSAVRTYVSLAMEAGVISAEEGVLIAAVKGYSQQETRRVNERREVTRRGEKKAQHVTITVEQARKLKTQPDTPVISED